jgi:hypothetical protein
MAARDAPDDIQRAGQHRVGGQQQPQQERLVMRGDLSQAPVAAGPEDCLLHPGEVEEMLQVRVPELGPQRGRGVVVRSGDHGTELSRLSAGQVPVLIQRLAQHRA